MRLEIETKEKRMGNFLLLQKVCLSPHVQKENVTKTGQSLTATSQVMIGEVQWPVKITKAKGGGSRKA